ncbi:uncharacterized protein LOC119573145 isoform X2 [Penaeus monodon]|uniref:uncharacterized protein LOC119573145 isoform X2 n=1 Tax=Penaeus monodon TaxID=6687 RepID=UPI0018A6E6E9|nr:uncharacterized protein LOC119573145 isoform X2 [Penaeus monodon]
MENIHFDPGEDSDIQKEKETTQKSKRKKNSENEEESNPKLLRNENEQHSKFPPNQIANGFHRTEEQQHTSSAEITTEMQIEPPQNMV